MSDELKQIPIEIKLEAANLKLEEMARKLSGSLAMINQMESDSDAMSKIGLILTSALHEIKTIKGEPPIQVARTIATHAIEKANEIALTRMELHEEAITKIDQILFGSGDTEGAQECPA